MWKVIRHPGRQDGTWKIRYEGVKDEAIEDYEKIRGQMRQGGVGLVNPNGDIIARVWIHSSKENKK